MIFRILIIFNNLTQYPTCSRKIWKRNIQSLEIKLSTHDDEINPRLLNLNNKRDTKVATVAYFHVALFARGRTSPEDFCDTYAFSLGTKCPSRRIVTTDATHDRVIAQIYTFTCLIICNPTLRSCRERMCCARFSHIKPLAPKETGDFKSLPRHLRYLCRDSRTMASVCVCVFIIIYN